MEQEQRYLSVYDDTEPAEQSAPAAIAQEEAPMRKKRASGRIALIVLLCLALVGAGGYAAVRWGVPAVRYAVAVNKLEKNDRDGAKVQLEKLGDYRDAEDLLAQVNAAIAYDQAQVHLQRDEFAEALVILEQLGDFKDAKALMAEADRGVRYQKAGKLLEQGEREAAEALLAELGGYRDTDALLQEIENARQYETAQEHLARDEFAQAREILEKLGAYRDAAELMAEADRGLCYEEAAALMEQSDWTAAQELFTRLGDYRDAGEKAEECGKLYEKHVQRTYAEGCRLHTYGRFVEAYRTLNSIAEADYGRTAEVIEEIFDTSVRLAEKYAEAGDRGRALAFLQLVEEIDPEKGAQLREKLIPAEEFTLDKSFYFFDTSHINALSTTTTLEELASVILYMVKTGELTFGLTAPKAVDRLKLIGLAHQACDLVSEILPGHGSVYNPSVTVGERYVTFRLNVEQEYSEHQRIMHLKTFTEFCENSVMELAEVGLISDDMNARQKVEVIANWVGFYLTYDQTLETHDVGIAVETTSGVCEAYAALLNRMCNLAGVTTYGQIGDSGAGLTNARHIWSFHLDENGEIFYTDATWADPYSINFCVDTTQEPTIALFMEQYLDRCMRSGALEKEGTYGAGENMYICSDFLWGSHRPERTEEQIIGFHNIITGKTE